MGKKNKFTTKCWTDSKGKYHRVEGPAFIWSNGSQWYQHGKLHRLDGPAIVYNTGYKLWYYEGQYIPVVSQQDFESYLKLKAFL